MSAFPLTIEFGTGEGQIGVILRDWNGVMIGAGSVPRTWLREAVDRPGYTLSIKIDTTGEPK